MNELIRADADPLLADLALIRDRIQTAAPGITQQAATAFATEIRAAAPQDSGNLRSRIDTADATKRPDRPRWDAGFTNAAAYAGEEFYAAFVEFGHRQGKRTPEIKRAQKLRTEYADSRELVAPHPFIRPAFDRNVDSVADAMIDDLIVALEG